MTRVTTTTGYSAKSIDELPTLWDGFAKLVRAGLDITAFGANIMDLPPDYSTTSHDESDSGQQELYVALRGSGSVDLDGTSVPLDARPPRAGRRRDSASAVVRARRSAGAVRRRRTRRGVRASGLELGRRVVPRMCGRAAAVATRSQARCSGFS